VVGSATSQPGAPHIGTRHRLVATWVATHRWSGAPRDIFGDHTSLVGRPDIHARDRLVPNRVGRHRCSGARCEIPGLPMKVPGTASYVLGFAHKTSWVISQEYSGVSPHTLVRRAEVLGRITQVLGSAHICHWLAQPTTWVGRPMAVLAPGRYLGRVSRALMWRDPGTLSPLPVRFQAHDRPFIGSPEQSCQRTQHRLSPDPSSSRSLPTSPSPLPSTLVWCPSY